MSLSSLVKLVLQSGRVRDCQSSPQLHNLSIINNKTEFYDYVIFNL